MYQVHEFKWDDASVERFWDYYAKQNKIAYFAQQVGNEVFRIAKSHIKVQGKVLDYGCGKGHLIETMLKHGVSNIYGADFSKDSVEHVKNTFKKFQGFKDSYALTQLPSPKLQESFFDVVFLLETIEHLINPYLDQTLSELSRIISANGYVVITTPSNEDLDMQKVICPDCGAHFHRVQHVNSFSESALIQLLDKYGFDKVYCESINLDGYYTMRKRFARTLKRLIGMKTPGVNLVYIGKRRSE